ncbi:MAG: Zn-ribbon domain-containing OB-fold protein [Nitrososphaerota archaeon]|nr:Zn-ribbon domain-containing OB-fold protein [Nitrososphaerota archaeon]MDG6903491.1 Zn-ribbon domain-containing OB-fold protein [Nitrososphaerota archaeon]MDG6912034.1 Zn-ribbon domain-containing OB-fold protein [Nitrososphaerota archaeon]MDG6924766.1 Zn-ribbon domain-containing OB-fold protein [Nitrososphaerota archaeon]MDG6940871.1 Zn-ribbon domain-containing OB-fold protein [Nitrososphaerota archaeon]
MSEAPALHSRRPLTLRFDIPISRTHEFWDSLRAGKFVTTKCTKCGNVTFPPQSDCPRCMGSEFEWVDLGQDATLVTYTQVMTAPASFSAEGSYTVAIAGFRGGVRALAWLEGVKAEDARSGMKLRVEARSRPDGSPYYVFVRA